MPAIVRAIERLYPDRLAEHVERLAHHALRAELWEPAAEYSHQAGNRARMRSAFRAAAVHLEHALAALTHVAATRERTEQGIDIRLGLRSALRLLGEHGRIPELLQEAQSLADSLGDRRRLAFATYGLSNFYFHNGQHWRRSKPANALPPPPMPSAIPSSRSSGRWALPFLAPASASSAGRRTTCFRPLHG